MHKDKIWFRKKRSQGTPISTTTLNPILQDAPRPPAEVHPMSSSSGQMPSLEDDIEDHHHVDNDHGLMSLSQRSCQVNFEIIKMMNLVQFLNYYQKSFQCYSWLEIAESKYDFYQER